MYKHRDKDVFIPAGTPIKYREFGKRDWRQRISDVELKFNKQEDFVGDGYLYRTTEKRYVIQVANARPSKAKQKRKKNEAKPAHDPIGGDPLPMGWRTLTREDIFAGRSNAGGWNRRQLKIIGVKWPPRRGWIDRAAGKLFAVKDIEQFLSLKGKKPNESID